MDRPSSVAVARALVRCRREREPRLTFAHDAQHELNITLAAAPVAARQPLRHRETMSALPHPQRPLRHTRAPDEIAHRKPRCDHLRPIWFLHYSHHNSLYRFFYTRCIEPSARPAAEFGGAVAARSTTFNRPWSRRSRGDGRRSASGPQRSTLETVDATPMKGPRVSLDARSRARSKREREER